MSVRTVPKPESWLPAKPGVCRWCGQDIKNADGTPNTRRTWHAECVTDYHVCTGQAHGLSGMVAEKTANRCACCGVDMWTCSPHEPPVIDPATRKPHDLWSLSIYMPHKGGYHNARYSSLGRYREYPAGPFSPIWKDYHDVHFGGWSGWFSRVSFHWRSDAQIDHIIPLWRVDRSKPFAEIIAYWRLGNLQILCGDCHKAKTAREAGERAAMKREAQQLAKEIAA